MTPTTAISSSGARHNPFSDTELEHAVEILRKTHDPELVHGLERWCRDSRRRRLDEGKDSLGFVGYIDDGDTYVTMETFDWKRVRPGYKITSSSRKRKMMRYQIHYPLRHDEGPPWRLLVHRDTAPHLLPPMASASSIFAQRPFATLWKRIPICQFMPWMDVHYCQGVADILQNEPRARYVSLHQSPAFPFQGAKHPGPGGHSNVNTVTMVGESSWTCGYRQDYEEQVLPFISSESWRPDLVVVCAGYDALDSDELVSVFLQARDFGEMTRRLVNHLDDSMTAHRVPIVFGLEGGYQLGHRAGGGNMQQAVLETLLALGSNRDS